MLIAKGSAPAGALLEAMALKAMHRRAPTRLKRFGGVRRWRRQRGGRDGAHFSPCFPSLNHPHFSNYFRRGGRETVFLFAPPKPAREKPCDVPCCLPGMQKRCTRNAVAVCHPLLLGHTQNLPSHQLLECDRVTAAGRKGIGAVSASSGGGQAAASGGGGRRRRCQARDWARLALMHTDRRCRCVMTSLGPLVSALDPVVCRRAAERDGRQSSQAPTRVTSSSFFFSPSALQHHGSPLNSCSCTVQPAAARNLHPLPATVGNLHPLPATAGRPRPDRACCYSRPRLRRRRRNPHRLGGGGRYRGPGRQRGMVCCLSAHQC